jgi:hypothetical protein
MQQRRLRLGDIVDDYCPRERRITNHAIVAMIEDEVKRTRCTTCDAEHEFKQARIPAQRRKKESAAAGATEAAGAAPRKRPAVDAPEPVDPDLSEIPDVDETPAAPVPSGSEVEEAAPLHAAPESSTEPDAADEPSPIEDEGPVHRRLIRATLPRPEGQPPERKMPEFTIHQRDVNGNRAGRHRRGARPGQVRTQHGNGQPPRFGGPRQGQGQPQGQRRRKRRR